MMILLLGMGCSSEKETEENEPEEKAQGFYVKGFENINACVEFSVEVEASTTYTLHIMAFNYSKGTATCSLYINGQKELRLEFNEQSKWREKVVEVRLAAGVNKITFQRDSGDNGQFYLDYIDIDI